MRSTCESPLDGLRNDHADPPYIPGGMTGGGRQCENIVRYIGELCLNGVANTVCF